MEVAAPVATVGGTVASVARAVPAEAEAVAVVRVAAEAEAEAVERFRRARRRLPAG